MWGGLFCVGQDGILRGMSIPLFEATLTPSSPCKKPPYE